ncbi:NEDD4-binding protein 1 [Dissostichus eleginoides]|uniref:NEDD4-binding protein 1 n=1 Tax=Dissostichus eleginoides TaxID=100907 RepID=A0AAD9BW28_DISEL|nr:NEDD4-binding protein 1 [Dissostichus eleginoides]
MAETTREEQRREIGKIICERAGEPGGAAGALLPQSAALHLQWSQRAVHGLPDQKHLRHIVVGSTGFLLISGLAEPVVRAYSLITDMVERYKGTQSRRSETTDRGMGETLDSRRAFKSLVENWEDKHILDLLVLPALVKEILLELVIESGLGSNPSPDLTDGNAGARSLEDSGVRWDKPSSVTYKLPESPDRWVEGMTSASGKDSAASSFQLLSSGSRGLAEGADERLLLSPQEVVGQSEAASISTEVKDVRGEDEEQEVLLSVGNKEFLLLLKFFTAMGYTEEIVKRVLARTGPKEVSQILDVVQQEQNRSDHEEGKKTQDGDESNRSERNRPCETEHREEEEMEISGGDVLMSSNGEAGVVSEGEEAGATGRDRPKERERARGRLCSGGGEESGSQLWVHGAESDPTLQHVAGWIHSPAAPGAAERRAKSWLPLVKYQERWTMW